MNASSAFIAAGAAVLFLALASASCGRGSASGGTKTDPAEQSTMGSSDRDIQSDLIRLGQEREQVERLLGEPAVESAIAGGGVECDYLLPVERWIHLDDGNISGYTVRFRSNLVEGFSRIHGEWSGPMPDSSSSRSKLSELAASRLVIVVASSNVFERMSKYDASLSDNDYSIILVQFIEGYHVEHDAANPDIQNQLIFVALSSQDALRIGHSVSNTLDAHLSVILGETMLADRTPWLSSYYSNMAIGPFSEYRTSQITNQLAKMMHLSPSK